MVVGLATLVMLQVVVMVVMVRVYAGVMRRSVVCSRTLAMAAVVGVEASPMMLPSPPLR